LTAVIQTGSLEKCPNGLPNSLYNVQMTWLKSNGDTDLSPRMLDLSCHPNRTRNFLSDVVHTNIELCACERNWLESLPGKLYNLHRRHKVT
jgi:hypothetical protein